MDKLKEGSKLTDRNTRDNQNWQSFMSTQASLSVERNRWFLACMLLILVAFFCVYQAVTISKNSSKNMRVAFVRMHPNGGWDVELDDGKRSDEYFDSTVNSHLISFIENRYSKDPVSIIRDYTISEMFMSPNLHKEFISADGFDATKVAREFMSCDNCPTIEAHVNTINQYDSEKLKVNKKKQDVFRTHIFVTEYAKNRRGEIVDKNRKIATLQWRFRQDNERKYDHDMLKYNPLNIEVMKSDYVDSPDEGEQKR